MRIVLLAIAMLMVLTTSASAAQKETAFDRVVRTNILRCGYVVLPPELSRDPNTKEISGVSHDIIVEVAKRLGLKVEWTEEVNFATMAEGFKTGRYDALCFSTYRWLPSARAMEFTDPLFYSTTSIYVRKNDKRFNGEIANINSPSITVATIDGEASTAIHDEDFPQAKTLSMPQSTDLSMMLESVALKKADVAFANPLVVMPYMLSKPDALKKIKTKVPLRINGHSFAIGKGEHDLLTMLNAAIVELHASGFIDAVLDKYEKVPDSFVRVKGMVR